MKTLLLSHRDLQEVVCRVGVDRLMDQLIDRLTEALVSFDENTTEIPVRAGFSYESPVTGLIEWMPLMEKRSKVLMKMVGYHPGSPESHQLPTILSTLSRYDTTTGHLVALTDGTFLTAMRTGAASAVASRLLARAGSTRLGLIGCGAQAVTQLHAIARVFEINEVFVHDVDAAAMATFRSRVARVVGQSVAIRSMEPEALVAASDIVSVATSVAVGCGPVFAHGHTQPWLHINAVGSDFPGKIELPKPLLLESFVCPDCLGQARVEGECQQLEAGEIQPDWVAVARRPGGFASMREQKTVFDSTGWALEDQVAMDLILEHAGDLSIGSQVQIECISGDPRDPYEFLAGSLVSEKLAATNNG